MNQPSEKLLNLARGYLSVVDSDSESANRTALHELLMDQLEAEHYPFNSRVEARWIARWLVDGQRVATDYGEQRVMWAELNYINRTVKNLYTVPPDDNASGLTPVLVVLLPYGDYSAERSL